MCGKQNITEKTRESALSELEANTPALIPLGVNNLIQIGEDWWGKEEKTHTHTYKHLPDMTNKS